MLRLLCIQSGNEQLVAESSNPNAASGYVGNALRRFCNARALDRVDPKGGPRAPLTVDEALDLRRRPGNQRGGIQLELRIAVAALVWERMPRPRSHAASKKYKDMLKRRYGVSLDQAKRILERHRTRAEMALASRKYWADQKRQQHKTATGRNAALKKSPR